MTEFKGPQFCAECDAQFTREIIEAGGSRPAAVTIRGHVIPIPGLWACTGCHEAIRMGVRQSRITYRNAMDYLGEVYGPVMVAAAMSGDGRAAGRVLEAAEVSVLLGAVIELQDQPGGLDFIPECTGDCGHDRQRRMAHLN